MKKPRRAIIRGNDGAITHFYRTGEKVYATRASFLPHYYDCQRVGGDQLYQSVSRKDLQFIEDIETSSPLHSAGMITFWIAMTAFFMLVIGIALGYILGGG